MLIDAVELHHVALPMVRPFAAAHGTVDRRELVLVRLVGADGEGWGECAALPEPTYTAEFTAGAWLVLREHLAPRLLAARQVEAATLDDVVGGVVGHPMARAALELALLDAEGRLSGTSLATRLAGGAPSPSVPAGAAVGLVADTGALVERAEALVTAGYRRLKIKIAPGRDVDPLSAVRAAVGPEVVLVADANGAYRLGGGGVADAEGLAALDDLSLACLEQPLPADDLEGHAELARRLTTPVCLDESLTTPRRTVQALDTGACSVVCVKAPRYGSWLAAAGVLDDCRRRGVDAWVGGMLDAGPGRAANLALAAHRGATVAGDVSAATETFRDDVCPARPLVRGDDGSARLEVPGGPGLGVAVDPAALDRLSLRSETLRA